MNYKFKNELKGKRIILKRTKPTYKIAQTMFNTIILNKDHLDPWFPWSQVTKKVEDSLKYLFDKEEETKKGNKIEYGIYIKQEYIGNISIFDLNNKDKSAEIGYWISKFHIRKGYTSEALQILEKEGFNNLKLNRIQIQCDSNNLASSGVARKCGYKYEGKLRQNKYNTYVKGFVDTLIFSKLKSEYNNKK